MNVEKNRINNKLIKMKRYFLQYFFEHPHGYINTHAILLS
jgi:hypothetical protein